MTKVLETDDLIVVLLGAPGRNPRLQNRINGITRLEKLIFVLEKEGELQDDLKEDAGFEPHNFGPFSKKIYQAIETLQAAGLVRATTNEAPDTDDVWEESQLLGTTDGERYVERQFQLTDLGQRYFSKLTELVSPRTLKTVAEIKDRLGLLPLRSLIRYVYENPAYRPYLERSIIRDDVLGA